MYLMESAPCARTIINGREVDYFCGCGYFGLQGHPDLVRAASESVQKYGIGTATSRFGYGDTPLLLEVEEKAAHFFGGDDALFFVSGYLGNTILLHGLADHYDIVFADEASHYSVFDGAYSTRKPVCKFAHRDADDLLRVIREQETKSFRPLIITDGVFPVSGEIAPLPEYWQILSDYTSPLLIVDDAHATGVLGRHGRGTLEYFGLEGEGRYAARTMSKAMGAYGGVITGDKNFIDHLRQSSGVFQGSTPVPTPMAAAASLSLDLLNRDPSHRKKLYDNVTYAKVSIRKLGFDIPDTPVPILCLSSNDMDLKTVQNSLFDEGIAVLHVAGGGYSSVPSNGAIRIAIFSTHTKNQIDGLVQALSRHFSK